MTLPPAVEKMRDLFLRETCGGGFVSSYAKQAWDAGYSAAQAEIKTQAEEIERLNAEHTEYFIEMEFQQERADLLDAKLNIAVEELLRIIDGCPSQARAALDKIAALDGQGIEEMIKAAPKCTCSCDEAARSIIHNDCPYHGTASTEELKERVPGDAFERSK